MVSARIHPHLQAGSRHLSIGSGHDAALAVFGSQNEESCQTMETVTK